MRRLEYFPSAPEKKIRNVKLTDEQYHEFSRLSGMMFKSRMDALVNSPSYKTIPDHLKVKTMKAQLELARSYGWQNVCGLSSDC
jgi:hypothetical protein